MAVQQYGSASLLVGGFLHSSSSGSRFSSCALHHTSRSTADIAGPAHAPPGPRHPPTRMTSTLRLQHCRPSRLLYLTLGCCRQAWAASLGIVFGRRSVPSDTSQTLIWRSFYMFGPPPVGAQTGTALTGHPCFAHPLSTKGRQPFPPSCTPCPFWGPVGQQLRTRHPLPVQLTGRG